MREKVVIKNVFLLLANGYETFEASVFIDVMDGIKLKAIIQLNFIPVD